MRLEFRDEGATFADHYGLLCRLKRSSVAPRDILSIGVLQEVPVRLTRGMVYALLTALQSWLDTGEFPQSVECVDDPPRIGESG